MRVSGKLIRLIIAGWLIAAPAASPAAASAAPIRVYPDSIAATVSDTLPQAQRLGEVVVSGRGAMRRVGSLRLGAETLEMKVMEKAPVLFGEVDIIKSITLLPGVRQESEGSGGYMVRGGTASQNQVQLDGATIFNPTHVMGIFSTFNEDALGSATLYKGLMPAHLGGATSSALDITLAPGNMESWGGSATIGLLAAKASASGPIIRDRLSLAVNARRSYVDAFLKIIPKYRHTVMHFCDVNAKLSYRPRPDDYIDLALTTSRDNLGISTIMWMDWGNMAASARWTARRGDSRRFITTAAWTGFSGDMWMDIMATRQRLDEYIRTGSLNHRAIFTIAEDHELEAGLRSELFKVKSAEWTVNDIRERDIRSGWANDIWLSYEGRLSGRLSLSAGARLSIFSALRGHSFRVYESFYSPVEAQGRDGIDKTYLRAEPRLSVNYSLGARSALKAGLASSSQNLHAIRTTASSFPFDRYALTSAKVRPESAVQYSAGYTATDQAGCWEWSAEAYYKQISNVYDYRSGVNMFTAVDLEELILGGRGRSYGLELMVRKNTGRITGWVAYTLSKTQTRIDGINDGLWYDASNDRRSDLNIVGMYSLTPSWSLSASFIYASGQALSVPDAKYQLSGATVYYYGKRNGYRTPPTHRLDISASYSHRGRRFSYEWNFGIYNLYNRYNPYMIFFENDPSKPSGTRGVQYSMYGIVPSVSYTLKF